MKASALNSSQTSLSPILPIYLLAISYNSSLSACPSITEKGRPPGIIEQYPRPLDDIFHVPVPGLDQTSSIGAI